MGVSEILHSQEVSSGLGVSSETLHAEDGAPGSLGDCGRPPPPRNASGFGRGFSMKVSETAHHQKGKFGLRAGS